MTRNEYQPAPVSNAPTSTLETEIPPNDYDTIKSFFEFFSPDENEIHTVAFLSDSPKGAIPGYGTFHGKFDDIWETLITLQSIHGPNVSLHITLNLVVS